MSLSKWTVVQLRAALEAEGLDTSGLKPALMQRYKDALDAKAVAPQTKRSTATSSVQVAEASPKRQRTRTTLEISPTQVDKKVTKKSEPEAIEQVIPESKEVKEVTEAIEGSAMRKRKAVQAEEKPDIRTRATRKKLEPASPQALEPLVEIEQTEKKVPLKKGRKKLSELASPPALEPPPVEIEQTEKKEASKKGRKKLSELASPLASEPPVEIEEIEKKADRPKRGNKKAESVDLPAPEPPVEEVEPVGRSTRNKTIPIASERRSTRRADTAKPSTPPKLRSKPARGKKAKEAIPSPSPIVASPESSKKLRVEAKTTSTQPLSEESEKSSKRAVSSQPVSPSPEAPTKTPPPAKATPAKATPAKATPAKATPAQATPAQMSHEKTPAQSSHELKTPPSRTISTRRTPTPSSLTSENKVETPQSTSQIATRRTSITPSTQALTPASKRKRAAPTPNTLGSALSSSLSSLSSPVVATPVLSKSTKKITTPAPDPVLVTPSVQTSAVKSTKKKVFTPAPEKIVEVATPDLIPLQATTPSTVVKSTRKTARTPALVSTPAPVVFTPASTPLQESKELTPTPGTTSTADINLPLTSSSSRKGKRKATPQTLSAQESVLQTPKIADADATPLPAVEVFQILKINKRREKAPIVDTPFRTSTEAKSTQTPKPAEAQPISTSTPKSSVSDVGKLLLSPQIEEKSDSDNGEDLTQTPAGKNQGKISAVKNSSSKVVPSQAMKPADVQSLATPTRIARRRSLSMENYAKKLLGEAESPHPSKALPKSARKTTKQVNQQTKQAPVETNSSIAEKSVIIEKAPPVKPIASIPQSPWEISLHRLTVLTKAESTWVVSIPQNPHSAGGEVFMREAIKTGFCWPRNSLPSGEHSWLLYHAAMCLGQNAGNFLGTKHTVPIGAHTYDIRPFERQMYYHQVLFGKAQDSSLLNFCCVLIRPMSIMLVVTSKQSHLLANGLLEYIEQSLHQKL